MLSYYDILWKNVLLFPPAPRTDSRPALLPSVASARRRPSLRQRHAVYLRHLGEFPAEARGAIAQFRRHLLDLSQRVRGIRQGAHVRFSPVYASAQVDAVSVRGGGVSRRARGRRLPLGWRRGRGRSETRLVREQSLEVGERRRRGAVSRERRRRRRRHPASALRRGRAAAQDGEGTPRRVDGRGPAASAPAEPRDRTWGDHHRAAHDRRRARRGGLMRKMRSERRRAWGLRARPRRGFVRPDLVANDPKDLVLLLR